MVCAKQKTSLRKTDASEGDSTARVGLGDDSGTRKREFFTALNDAAQSIHRAACIFKSMVDAGDDVSFVRDGLQWLLLRIANNLTLPEVFTRFDGRLQANIAKLPIEQQRLLMDSIDDPFKKKKAHSGASGRKISTMVEVDRDRYGLIINNVFFAASILWDYLQLLGLKPLKPVLKMDAPRISQPQPIKLNNCKECAIPLPKDCQRNLCDKCFDRMY